LIFEGIVGNKYVEIGNSKFIRLLWSEFKVIRRQLLNFHPNNGYFFTNTLDISTSSLSLDYINPSNQKRLDLIMKLHKEGKSNKKIVEILKVKGIKRRNKNDDYSVKDVFMCIKKLEVREERKKDIKYKLGMWKLCREM